MDVPPPLVSFFLFHRSMRRGAERLVRFLEADRTPQEQAAVARWFDHYRRACLLHAQGEDTVLWPALLAERPELKPAVLGMDHEHAELAVVLADLARELGDPDRHDDARKHAGRLVEVLTAHLDDEEAGPVPALVGSCDVEGLAELMRAVQQGAGPEGAAIAVPFFLADATDEERAAVLGALPPPLRDAYETSWRAAYDELRAVLGPD